MTDSYFLAQSLVGFRASINAAFPKRDKSSDGWIGDASHAARVSDHNPCWTCTGRQHGIVRAIDVDVDDNDAGHDLRTEVLKAAIGHRAVWYVISNGIIYSRTYGWKARAYTGENGHFHHVHTSLQHTEAAAFDTTLVLRQISVPGGSSPSKPATDVTITSWCVQHLANDRKGVSGECLHDCDQVMAFAGALVPAVAANTRPYYLKVSKLGNWDEAGKMLEYAVRIIQSKAGLTQDGVFGPKTGAYMRKFGYTVR